MTGAIRMAISATLDEQRCEVRVFLIWKKKEKFPDSDTVGNRIEVAPTCGVR